VRFIYNSVGPCTLKEYLDVFLRPLITELLSAFESCKMSGS
jgi:hypothetical protein